jgi:hypothetical protein
MIRGTVIELGDQNWILPPANVATMELHADFFKGAAKGDLDAEGAFDKLPVIADIVFRSLKRNYPDITLDFVKDHVDMGNMEELMSSVFSTSGLVKAIPAGE